MTTNQQIQYPLLRGRTVALSYSDFVDFHAHASMKSLLQLNVSQQMAKRANKFLLKIKQWLRAKRIEC